MRKHLSNAAMDRVAWTLGVPGVLIVVWSLFSLLVLVGWHQLWLNHISFGSPYPMAWAALDVMAAALILVPGVTMLLRKKSLAWVNYLFAPLRLVLLAPTVFPLLVLLGSLGIRLPVVLTIGLVVAVEVARCCFVHTWIRQASSPGRAHSEALDPAV